jgi:ABC-type uncharacterized transport system substrate-binding protein
MFQFFKFPVFLVLALGACLASAHPHLRLAYQLSPVLVDGKLTGLTVSWQMDAQNSNLVRENIDLNQNGLLDQDELQAFAETNQALMQAYQYFLTIENTQNGKPLAFEVKDFVAKDAGRGFQGGIYFEFFAQLATDQAHQHVQLQLQDPTWYIGFSPRMGKVLVADSDCTSDFTREKRLTPSQGEQEFQRILVQCSPGTVARPGEQISPSNGSIKGDNS